MIIGRYLRNNVGRLERRKYEGRHNRKQALTNIESWLRTPVKPINRNRKQISLRLILMIFIEMSLNMCLQKVLMNSKHRKRMDCFLRQQKAMRFYELLTADTKMAGVKLGLRMMTLIEVNNIVLSRR